MGNPFLSPLIERATVTPDALFGVFNDGDDWIPVSVSKILQRSLQYAGLIASRGVQKGDIVIIIGRDKLDACAAFIGSMVLGAVPSFMPFPSIKQNAHRYWSQHHAVFKRIGPRVILVYDELYEALRDAICDADIALIKFGEIDGRPILPLPTLPEGHAIALLQHSSGTTGLKKGVMLSYDAIATHIMSYARTLGLLNVLDVRIGSWLPLYHDMGLITSFLLPVWSGIPIISIDPFDWTRDPSLMFDAIEEYGATHCWVPNFALLHHVRSARGQRVWDLSNLQALIACSEPCKAEAFDTFVARFSAWNLRPEVLQTCYAMAETVFAISQSSPRKSVRRLAVDRASLQTKSAVVAALLNSDTTILLSNGPPIAGCVVKICKDGIVLPENAIGEVCVRAPWMFAGYHKNLEATSHSLRGEWFHTGDLGFLNQGEVFIVGRVKDVVIVNGKNIFAHDVEQVASAVPGVKGGRVAAFGLYSEALGTEQLVVVAERDGPASDDFSVVSAINCAVADEVGIVCGDVRIVNQGWLVKTTSGKVSRSENSHKYQNHDA